MVSVEEKNAFELREHIGKKVLDSAGADPFKACFVQYLGLTGTQLCRVDFHALSLYQKCAISGLNVVDETVPQSDLSRLLGQASRIDSTPMPWVSDLFGVMSIKWLVDECQDSDMQEHFNTWIESFIPQRIDDDRLNPFERDLARFIRDSSCAVLTTATIPLFLHYRGIRTIVDQQERHELIGKFMTEFRHQASGATGLLVALMAYCFDHANSDLAPIPPRGWSLTDLTLFLNRVPIGLKRWTWEKERGRTRGSDPVKWLIENEYHVQNLLYALFAPVFDDVADEINLQQVGQKNPRADLYLPGLHTIIEVKYRKNTGKSFSKLIGEVAEDASLYHADPRFKDAFLVCFLWDHTRSTQEHAKFSEGVMLIEGVDGCVVVNSPSFM